MSPIGTIIGLIYGVIIMTGLECIAILQSTNMPTLISQIFGISLSLSLILVTFPTIRKMWIMGTGPCITTEEEWNDRKKRAGLK